MDTQIEGTGGSAPSKIVINGQEYDPTEAQELIDTGRKTRDYEKQWNTKVDAVWPEFGKATTTLKQRDTELAEARAKLAQYEQKKEDGIENQTDIQQAKEAARKLGIPLREDLDKEGYIKKEQLETYLEEREKQRDAVKKILDTADSLEKEIDGKDGRPKFNKRVVLAYANTYKMADLKAAYEDMHKDSLDAWKAAQIDSKKTGGLKTLKGNGVQKEPAPKKIDDSNVGAALHEALYGAEQ